jgi:hypothetical protein
MNFSHSLSISRASFSARLASALAFSMQIPEGSTLVCVLGQGDESSNLSALSNWVEKELCEMDDDNLNDPLPVLIGNLERTLNSAQERMA